MGLERYPFLAKLYDELTKLAAEEAARAAARQQQAVVRESCGVKEVSLPWVGQFLLTGPQHKVACFLLEALMECKNPEVEERVLLRVAGVPARRLEDVFRGSPAWGTLIISGSKPWLFRLPPLPPTSDEEE